MSTSGHFDPQFVLGLLLGDKPSIERKRKIARLLGDQGGRQPFSVGYLENIVAGRQEPSPDGDMYRALTLVLETVIDSLLNAGLVDRK